MYEVDPGGCFFRSELTGISYKYYQQIEISQRIDLRFSTLEKLSRAYGIGVHELIAPEFPRVSLPKAKAKRTV
jgi:hypothetical protein